MKKYLPILIFVCAFLCAQCGKNVIDPVEEDPMVFSAIASHSTKSIITTTNYPPDQPFVIQATHFGDNDPRGSVFMERQRVSYNFGEALWKTSEDHFWPAAGTLHFWAGSPDIPEVDVTDENGTVAHWSVPSEEYTQTDLCCGEVSENCLSHSAIVPIVFSHALSQICIKARTLRNNSYSRSENNLVQANIITTVLDSVKLEGIVSEGVFTQNPKGWTLDRDARASYTVYKSDGEGLELGCDRYDTPILTILGSMLLIPQDMDGEAVIREWHHILVRSSVTDTSTGEIISDDTNILYRESALPVKHYCKGWDIDYKYTFRIAVGLEDTELAVAVTDWTESKEIIIGDE